MSNQIDQWRGDFGDAYVGRNPITQARLKALTSLWAQILHSTATAPPMSILEIGANVGANLHALRCLSTAEFWAVEPNAGARGVLIDSGIVHRENVCDATAQRLPLPDHCVDLAFTSGVLIHIPPDELLGACREIYRCARRIIVCIEYFSDEPEEKIYRGKAGLLFKRDFGAFWLDNFPDLSPLDCGFSWKRMTGLDNVTWWVLIKARESTDA